VEEAENTSNAEEESNEEKNDSDADADEDAEDDDAKESENDDNMDVPEVEEPKQKKNNMKRKRDDVYGVSRGVDFRGVNFVINVDFPKSVKSYTHRIGRTARGGASGTALSLVGQDDKAEWKYLERVQSRQKPVMLESQDLLHQPAPLAFDIAEIDCFRYRVEDVRRAVTHVAVREAQISDVKKEMLNSEKLRAHFEDNPRDLNILEHDKSVGKARIQPHLGTIPTYLVPAAMQAQIPTKVKKVRRTNFTRNQKRRTDNDPLHTFQHT